MKLLRNLLIGLSVAFILFGWGVLIQLQPTHNAERRNARIRAEQDGRNQAQQEAAHPSSRDGF